jgi:ankyrin repeat protein
MGACNSPKWDNVSLLIRRGANVNIVDNVSKSIYYEKNYNNIYIVLTFNNKKCNRTALHWAAQNGAPDDIITAFMEAGADVEIKDSNGETPSVLARSRNHRSTANFIEQHCKPIKSANFIV